MQCNWGTRHRSNMYKEMDLDIMVVYTTNFSKSQRPSLGLACDTNNVTLNFFQILETVEWLGTLIRCQIA